MTRFVVYLHGGRSLECTLNDAAAYQTFLKLWSDGRDYAMHLRDTNGNAVYHVRLSAIVAVIER